MGIEDPTLAELVDAIRAEDRSVDLTGAVRRAGAQNYVVETDEWIYRFPRDWIDLDREIAVLAVLDGRMPVEIPRVEWVGRHSRFCAYRKIIGRNFDRETYRSATRGEQRSLAASMAEYVAALHDAVTEGEIASIGIPDFFTLRARTELIELSNVPDSVRPDVSALLDRAREVSDELSGRQLLDNDFTTDNLVTNDEMTALTGIWDFSGVSVGPASFDFRALLREPDPLTEDVVAAYEKRTGRTVSREAYLLALRITDLLQHLRRGPAATVNLVQEWRMVTAPNDGV